MVSDIQGLDKLGQIRENVKVGRNTDLLGA
jgi:hypothetical protein